MEIKLICMDLDGTALQADRKTFSPRLIAALDAAHAKGIAIAPVTYVSFVDGYGFDGLRLSCGAWFYLDDVHPSRSFGRQVLA